MARRKPESKSTRRTAARTHAPADARASASPGRPSSLVDTRIIYCGDCLEQLAKLPDACVDPIYIDPPFNSNRNYEVFWGVLSEPRASASGSSPCFEDRHASTAAYIDYMRPRCVRRARELDPTSCATLVARLAYSEYEESIPC